MSLGTKQEIFTTHLSLLIRYINAQGWGCRIKEVLRTKEQAQWYYEQGKGIKNSNHRNGVAADLYISDIHGKLLWDGPEYAKAATFWKEFTESGLEHCWGGDFSRYRDVYHFSIRHGGVV